MNRFYVRSWLVAAAVFPTVVIGVSGCKPPESISKAPAVAAKLDPAQPVEIAAPQSYEANAEELLAARLSPDKASEGWIRLFDGYTLYGWEIAGAANWRVEDGSIVVDSGDQCLLCTSLPWQDYELTLEFKAGEKTNSGVFLRTPLEPEDPAFDCYEVNIAADDNPFPTASVVKRQKVDDSESAKGSESGEP